ncbi:MAG: outer membrane protein assembly factor BamA [Chitinivibrionales bacterium]|nr:outer membrane protein assembly factor BamA [Chitinivibrionales bacterium]
MMKRIGNVPIVCILIVACAVMSHGQKILDTLIIKGLMINKPEMILKNIPLTQGAPFTSIDVSEALKSLYRLGLFKDVSFSIAAETESSASLVLTVSENPACDNLEFSGIKKLKQKDIEEKLPLRKGDIITAALLHESVEKIKSIYENEGYLLSSVTYNMVDTKVPGNKIIKFSIDEGAKVRVKKVTFHGNEQIKEKELKSKLKTKEKRWYRSGEFNRESFRRHLDSLILHYNDKGYLDAQITHDSVWYDENKKDIYIDITLSEGKQFYAGNFFFSGNKIIETSLLTSRIILKKGKPFSKSKLEMTKYFIGGTYREEGYLWVQVQDQNQYRNDTIDVVFTITEGRAAMVQKIDVKGNTKTRENVIRRELALFPGQKYKQSYMERSIRDLYQLDYFSAVNPDLKPNDDGTIDLVYTVEEKENIGKFSAGATYSAQNLFGGNFSISIPNFRGKGQVLAVTTNFTTNNQTYSLDFTEPWIFDTPTLLRMTGSYERLKSEEYDNHDASMRFYFSRKIKWPDDYFSLGIGYKIGYKRDDYYNKHALDKAISSRGFQYLHKGYISRLELDISRNDTKYDPMFPDEGSSLLLSTYLAGVGGNYSYLKSILSYDWYFPLLWKLVISFESKYGILTGLHHNKYIDYTDLFLVGGTYGDIKIRGYGSGGLPIWGQEEGRGLNMLGFSSSIRFPIVERQLYFGVFGDVGNCWDAVKEVTLKNMYPGAGFGFRLNLPMIGLMGVDFAWRFKEPNPENPHITRPHIGNDIILIMMKGF